MDFGDAAGGMLTVRGGDGSDVFSAGRRGLAFNGDVDPEVTGFPRDPENPSGLSFFGGEGDDRLSARGGSGTGGPAAWAWPHFSGSFGDDSLLSGPGRSTLSGGDGDDVEYGGDGDDVLYEGTAANGADELYGDKPFSVWSGDDRVDYSDRAVPVSVTRDDQPNDGEPGERGNVHSDTEAP